MTRVLLGVLLAAASVSAQRPLLPRAPAPDLVLFNGKIITVDRAFSIHEAVAIIGDRILAVGNNDQMQTVAGSTTRMIDLKGHAVIPGLMDNHLHGAGGGPGVDLSRARSMADVATETRQDRELSDALEEISKGTSFWNRLFG